MLDNIKSEVNQEKVYKLMQRIIDIEKKYLYDKHYIGSFDLDRIKNITELIDKEVENNVD